MNIIKFEKLCNESIFTREAFKCYKKHMAKMTEIKSQESVYIHESEAKRYSYGLWMYFAGRGKETYDYSACTYCIKLNEYVGAARRTAIDKLIKKALGE